MNKLGFGPYAGRQTSLFLQFMFARKAMAEFRNSPESIARLARKDIEDSQKMMDASGQITEKTDPNWTYSSDQMEDVISSMTEFIPAQLSDFELRMNQNQLILHLSFFEMFVKDIHRQLLRSDPARLDPTRKIELGRLIAKGVESVLDDEVERLVHSLDRKKFEDRVTYFRNELKIDWSFDGIDAPKIGELLEFRNRILHSEPDLGVPREELTACFVTCMEVARTSFIQAYVQCSNGFELERNMEPMVEEYRGVVEGIS